MLPAHGLVCCPAPSIAAPINLTTAKSEAAHVGIAKGTRTGLLSRILVLVDADVKQGFLQ